MSQVADGEPGQALPRRLAAAVKPGNCAGQQGVILGVPPLISQGGQHLASRETSAQGGVPRHHERLLAGHRQTLHQGLGDRQGLGGDNIRADRSRVDHMVPPSAVAAAPPVRQMRRVQRQLEQRQASSGECYVVTDHRTPAVPSLQRATETYEPIDRCRRRSAEGEVAGRDPGQSAAADHARYSCGPKPSRGQLDFRAQAVRRRLEHRRRCQLMVHSGSIRAAPEPCDVPEDSCGGDVKPGWVWKRPSTE